MTLRRAALLLLLLVSVVTLWQGTGPVRDAGAMGLAGWLLLDLEEDRRRHGWWSALTVKLVTLGLVGCFVATLSGVTWLQVTGWGGFFVAAWFAARSTRRRTLPASVGVRD